MKKRIDAELTAYARRVLTDYFLFSYRKKKNLELQNAIKTLLAFASDATLNVIARQINQQKEPEAFILECFRQWELLKECPYKNLKETF